MPLQVSCAIAEVGVIDLESALSETQVRMPTQRLLAHLAAQLSQAQLHLGRAVKPAPESFQLEPHLTGEAFIQLLRRQALCGCAHLPRRLAAETKRAVRLNPSAENACAQG